MTSPLILKLERRDRLSPEERRLVEDIPARVLTFAAGDEMVREGDRPAVSTLILDGWAGRAKYLPGGRRSIIALHHSGDFVDLHSFLLKPIDHSVVALTACRVAQTPHERLHEVTERFPHLTRLLWLDTLVDAAVHREWIATVARRNAASRLAHLFCELFLRLQAVERTDGLRFELPLSQEILSDILGLSLVHVNRSLQDIRARGLLTWKSPRVRILDWDGLAELAAYDPAYLNLSAEPR
jgi:CRP-like cAMP-binding protein